MAIAATSMLEIRRAMRHFWRQSSDRLDLDQAVSGGEPRARGGVALSTPQSVDQRMRHEMRCRLSPTADVPSHTSGAAMGQKPSLFKTAAK